MSVMHKSSTARWRQRIPPPLQSSGFISLGFRLQVSNDWVFRHWVFRQWVFWQWVLGLWVVWAVGFQSLVRLAVGFVGSGFSEQCFFGQWVFRQWVFAQWVFGAVGF